MTATYYTILPAEVRLDKRLLPFERILFSDILSLANKKGYCFATNAYFAKTYGVSTVSISTWISSLVKYGYLRRVYDYKDNTKMIERRKLYIKPDFMAYKTSLSDPHQADFKQGIQGDFKDNNININNIKDNTDYTRKIDGGKSYRGPRVSDQLQAMLDRI
ncbi:helix-turn-helix domain-containing protein [Anaerococcus lactolyticus]|uniref:helix-turn-helix domain-containing protein n=1 Tax=Anaerococcus lactolyticus TaxID=33032 RepID=UPI00288C4C72|nr:helix-turn-helix domain-containing protein [Anaerococcus lactolyticus]